MAEDDDFEITPHRKLQVMEKEIEELKNRRLTPEEKSRSDELLKSMDRLGRSLNDMIDTFSSAASTMHVEEKEEKAVEPVMKKIDILMDQNQKIASGILAVADMIREEFPKLQEAVRRLEFAMPKSQPAPVSRMGEYGGGMPQMQRQMPRPPMGSGFGQGMSMPPMPQSPEPAPMPPGLNAFERSMPPGVDRKKGVFDGLFTK